jgi:malic enzyme
MKLAAARALADLVGDKLSVNKIIPNPSTPRVAPPSPRP